MLREFEAAKNKILKQSKASGGIQIGALKRSVKLPQGLYHIVISSMLDEKLIFSSNDYLVFGGANREENLSPLAKDGYRQIVDSSTKGVSIRGIKNYGMVSCFQEIARMNLAVVLDDDLYFTTEAFDKIVNVIFQGTKVGESLTIQDIRIKTELSRRYIISLLKIIEDRGLIEREVDDERVIKKLP